MKNLNTSLLIIFLAANLYIVHASNHSILDKIAASDIVKNKIDTGAFLVENNGVKIWYKVSGKGPICILPSPGWGPGCELYYNSLGKMEEFFTMVYVDTRGTGQSSRPELEQYTTTNFLLDIEAVRRDIHADKVWLMGHSKGGAIVLNYAFQNKDKVNGIVLIDASGGVNTPPEKVQEVMMQKQGEPWFASAAEYFSREPRDADDWIAGTQAVMPMFFSTTENFENNKEVVMQTSLSYDAFLGQKNWYDCENELKTKLPEIDIPVLIVVGMNDFICGAYVAKYLHRELPYSKLLPVEDAGHFPWMEQPELFFKGINEYLPKMNYQNSDL